MGLITLNEKQEIILKFFREGKSQRAIARETGVDRKTIGKYIKGYQQVKQNLLQSEGVNRLEQIDLISDLVAPPQYQVANREKRKLSDEMVAQIKYYLEENETKKQNRQAKQQKKIVDIHEALLDNGYQISYSTVRNTVNQLNQSVREAFIRIDYVPGDVCEFDWGEVNIYINGELKTFQLAVFASAYGNYRYACLFPKQKTECFIEAHVMFFEHLGGVYRTMVYDNMKVAVRKFVGLTEKEPTEALTKLAMYYGFSYRFCNVCSGNEKGHVERSVEYIRRKAFCDQDSFESLKAANEHLELVCAALNQRPQTTAGQQSAIQRLTEERAFLLPGMPRYETARLETSRVDKYSTITIDTCHYSVPDAYVGKLLLTKVYATHIRCYCDMELVAEHPRLYGNQEWSLQLEHYCRTLQRKPGALEHSVALKQADAKLQQLYREYYVKKEKSFVELLYLRQEYSLEAIEQAVNILQKLTPRDISTEKIKTLCQRQTPWASTVIATDSTIVDKSKEHLESYGALLPASTEGFTREVAIA